MSNNSIKSESDLKLNALLEVTKAINNNFSVSQILELYKDILQNRLGVGRLVLFSLDKTWDCLLTYGLPEYAPVPKFEEDLLSFNEIETIT
jgi:sigma-B regulation protein RsbU (phosphoserine phosphatase)